MPWSYPNDVPSSMQHFKPEIQVKAISIANAILKSGGDEGVAIATGIKRGKQMSKGGLLKVASAAVKGAFVGAAIGGIGAKLNNNSNRKYEKNKKNHNVIGGVIGGAIGGALIGKGIGEFIKAKKNYREFAKNNEEFIKNKHTQFTNSKFTNAESKFTSKENSFKYEDPFEEYKKQNKKISRERWKKDYGWDHDKQTFDPEHDFWKNKKYNDHYSTGSKSSEDWDDDFEDAFENTKSKYRKRDDDEWYQSFQKRWNSSFGGQQHHQYTPPKPPKPNRKVNLTYEHFFKKHKLNPNDFTTKKDLKKKYRQLAQQYHPDGGNGGTTKAFQSFQKRWEAVEKSPYFTKLAGLIKLAFESGAHSNLPNAWKTMGKGIGQGQRQDIPLAKGLPKVKPLNFQV